MHHHFIDPGGRYVAVIGDHEESSFLILSLYSPTIEAQIKLFVEELGEKLSKLGSKMPEFIIAGGDTNTVFSLIDKEGGSSALKHKAIHAFEDFKTRFDLIDTFRVKSPLSRNYSWETFNPTIIRERIDIIFASNTLLDHISEVSENCRQGSSLKGTRDLEI